VFRAAIRIIALVSSIIVMGSTALAAGAAKSSPNYLIKGDYFEGCECSSICPCIWSADATEEQCRGLVTYQVREGHYGSTNLKGTLFAGSITKSGKNLEKTAGTWEGVIYLPESASKAQRDALEAIARKEIGQGFAKLEVRYVPVTVTGPVGHEELTISSVGHLKIAPVKGANGKVIKIENPPSPLANPISYVAKAEVNTYEDGGSKWDFAGRNSFYGPFVMKSH